MQKALSRFWVYLPQVVMTVLPPVTLLQPSRIHFGVGCASEALTSFVRGRHRRVLLVTSPSQLTSAGRLAGVARAELAAMEIVMGIPPEPTTACCEQLRGAAKAFSPDLVVALGGGSVLDDSSTHGNHGKVGGAKWIRAEKPIVAK